MEPKHLTYFKAENFKRFDSLEVSDIGQFNLIVGDNNVGKTTLLEALLFDDNYDQFLINLEFAIENRELAIDKNVNYVDSYVRNKTMPLKYTFQLDNGKKNELTVSKKNLTQLTDKELSSDLIVQLKLNKSANLVQINLNNQSVIKVVSLLDEKKEILYHFPFLGAKIFYDEETADFTYTISASNKKLEDFKNEMKFFLPNLISIEEGTSTIDGDSEIILRETSFDSPMPLASYGDGFIKLFRCLLKMELSSNGRLMIDEIDSGIHYSRMKEFLKKVMQAAKNKNVQIFATTHSKECLGYFAKALEELGMQDSGRIIRLADTKSGIKAYTRRHDEFADELWLENEIR